MYSVAKRKPIERGHFLYKSEPIFPMKFPTGSICASPRSTGFHAVDQQNELVGLIQPYKKD